MNQRFPYIVLLSMTTAVLVAISGVFAQDVPPLPPLPVDESPELQPVLPDAAVELPEDEIHSMDGPLPLVHGDETMHHEGPYPDSCCADASCDCPKCSQAKAKIHNIMHLYYLRSYTGGMAQYTHEWNLDHAQRAPWHGNYYHTAWGRPIALVTPPTAAYQTRWSWGVGRTTVVPIYHQFGRAFPGTTEGGSSGQFRGTPMWPSHTDQFGVYYVRGPW